MNLTEFAKLKWKFGRMSFIKLADGRYCAVGDLNDGRGVIIDIREEKDLPKEPSGHILINLELTEEEWDNLVYSGN